jgi:ABC-type Zn uptake system ZnuABC Zn-binding protein ZnuA
MMVDLFKVDTPRRAVLAAIAAFAAMPVLAATPLKVVATTGMIADMVRQIGGEAAQFNRADNGSSVCLP